MESVFAAMKGHPDRCLYLDEKGAPPAMMAEMAARYGVQDSWTACGLMGATKVEKRGTCNGLPRMRLYDPHFIYTNGTSSRNGIEQSDITWGLMAWRFPVSFDGTKPIVLPAASNGYLSLGYSSDCEERENVYYGRTELEIKDITKLSLSARHGT